MISDRQGHGGLTIVLLAELAAILPRNPDRMPPLLGEARVIDDPSFNRPVPLYRRQHHLTDLGQNLVVRPVALAYKMQQRLMLRRRPFRRRNRRHWLDALARARHHQPHAIIAKRFGSIGVANHRRQTLDIRRKPRRRVT